MKSRLLVGLLLLSMLACALIKPSPTAGPATPTASPAASAEPAASATTDSTPDVSPSATPAASPSPEVTPSSSPTVQVPEDSIRVQFAANATAWSTEDVLQRNQMKTYLVRAMQDQLMTVAVSSPLEQVYITIVGLEDGAPLVRAQMGATGWSGKLPRTQDYAITLSTEHGAPARYTLQIIIPRRLSLDAQRTSVEHQGHLEPFSFCEYILEVPAGQLLMVDVLSQQLVGLSIVGHEDGNPYKRVVSEEPFWSGFVPLTQDYLINVVTADAAADYTLRVTLPREIRFASGAVSSELKATLPPLDVHTYVLAVSAGQKMEVELEPNATAHLEIYGYEDGQPLLRADLGQTRWEGLLPATQHYIIKVISRHDQQLTYKLEVSIK